MPSGTVASLHRWPVKSMAGEQVSALAIDRLGAPGDRAHAIFDLHGSVRGHKRITARETPRMLAWSASYPCTAGAALARAAIPEAILTGPDGTAYPWTDPSLPGALTADLGRPVALVRATDGQQDRPTTLLVTIEASRRAAEEHLGAPLDLRRFRCNVHLTLDAEPYAEQSWIGRCLRVGDAELDVLAGCVRCVVPSRDPDTAVKWPELMRWLARDQNMIFGVMVRARGAGVIAAGDPAELL